MALLNRVVAEASQIVGRELRRRNPQSGEISTTAPASQTVSATPAPTQSNMPNNPSGPTSSPLLFFVALGFGVVFTNLWIIVGVKYCFRYNARNRALRNGEDSSDPIILENMPTRPHRRRREKKLMTMDEVNERFPLMKYKCWVASRAREGLPTEGGVTAPPSRPASVNDKFGLTLPSSPTDIKHSVNTRPESAASNRDMTVSPATKNMGGEFGTDTKINEKDPLSTTVEEHHGLEVVLTTAETINKHPTTTSEDEEDEDDHIHTAVPTELLTNPGDSCAICIDTLEDDDEVRGLTCGHAFHATCLDPWLTGRRACCPLCKADYYTPKPRPEGESETAERTGRRRGNIPQAPPSAWIPVRGNRLIIPGRFGNESQHRSEGTGRSTQRNRRPRQHVTATVTPIHPEDGAADTEQNDTSSRRWVPSNPFRNMRLPFGRRAPAAPEATSTPSQLESGVVR
ncbi:hypothetical protein QTJ16_004908 [Diplocarpon rosae]|uniref:RING-type domain-containing protein n=1 Tax=Diplocarpon rosae TaxID=946125 RepID=A0AAD9SXI3_9HELO|nr:hypothetical protein QTJ16_004908 [Diplocarpon rosae]